MAQTSTSITGCNIGIWLDNASGTATDVSGSLNAAAITFTNMTGEHRTFASDWPGRNACGKDAKASITIIYTTATDEAMDIWKNWYFSTAKTARTLSLYFPDKNVGSDHYYGEFLLDGDWEIGATAGEAEALMISGDLVCNGEVSWTTATT